MEKHNPLLPFAFSTAAAGEKSPLNTDPRDRSIRDENAQSMYHTRGTRRGPVLLEAPSMPTKRKMGASFNEKDDIKKRDVVLDIDLDDKCVDVDVHVETNTNFHSDACLPSSPVLPHMSEYDIPTQYTVPDLPYGKHVSSDADFGIDSFNRFRNPICIQDPPTDDMDGDEGAESKALQAILQAFEDVSPSVSLEGLGLTEVPEQVRDLENLVIFDPHVLRQLYLTNNMLRALSPALFAFTKLNVLSVRHNRITQIPGALRRLQNLVDLNISSNKLHYLPPAILQLPRLRTFRAGPNPFEKVSVDAFPVHDTGSDRCLRYISAVQYNRRSIVALLKTLCLDAIARYDVTYRETRSWKKSTPKVLHSAIARAITKRNYEDHCSECERYVVEPHAEVYEWWDILENTEVPIRREFCLGLCARRYEMRHAEEYGCLTRIDTRT